MTEPKKKLTPSLPTVEESLAYADGYADALKAVRELDKAALIQERDILSVQLAAEKPLREHMARKAITLASRVAKLRAALKPFADRLGELEQEAHEALQVGGYVPLDDDNSVYVPVPWLRKARAALQSTEHEPNAN